MKNKYLLLSSIILLISCSNGGDIISLSSNSSISVNELKEFIGVCEYEYLNMVNEPLTKVSYFMTSAYDYLDEKDKPEFKMCGDSIKIKYYGEIDWLIVSCMEKPKFEIIGEIESVEYIKAEVKPVIYEELVNASGIKIYKFENTSFRYIVTDKEYHFSSIDDFEGCDEVYASYYEGVARAIYSFNPLL